MLGVEVGCPLAVIVGPLDLEVDGDLLEVVGHDLTAGDVDDRRYGDALRITGEPLLVRVFETWNLQDGVDAAGVEVERPRVLVMGGTAQSQRDRILETEESPNDQRAVGPRARARRNKSIPTCLDRIAVATIARDAGLDVLRIADELLSAGDIGRLRA
ncbi:Uncharacterised protein [Mycobacteroides abscessus subsp. abscessus]|nr:Uncharacterised protein [Mycobacteroides abscessus subsp. abscessus]